MGKEEDEKQTRTKEGQKFEKQKRQIFGKN